VSRAPHAVLPPDLLALRDTFEALAADAQALVSPLSDTPFHWRPPSGAWSIAMCLEHLNVTARLYLPKIDEGIAEAMQVGRYGDAPYSLGWFERMVIRRIEPPPWPKLTTRAAFVPAPDRRRADVMAAFGAYQVQYIDRLRQATGLHLTRARVKSPVTDLVRVSLLAAFHIMAAHERRHLWQARQVMGDPAFPRT